MWTDHGIESDDSLMNYGDEDPLRRALIVVDMQNDFMPGGSLAVAGGDEIIEGINVLVESGEFDITIATQDWHPRGHSSFKSSGGSGIWPDHCVQGTRGAELVSNLSTQVTHIVRKGTDVRFDSYSGIKDEGQKFTGLDGILASMEIDEVWVVGVAYDYCVKATVMDLLDFGYDVVVVRDLTRAVNTESVPALEHELLDEGVRLV